MGIQDFLNTTGCENRGRTVRFKSPYTNKFRTVASYIVDYEEDDARTIEQTQIFAAGKTWHNVGARNTFNRRIPNEQVTKRTSVGAVFKVVDSDDRNN